VDAVGERIAESVQQFFDAGFSTVWKLLPSGLLVALASAGAAREVHPPGYLLNPGQGASGRAVAEDGPVYLPDVLSEPDAVVLTESMRHLADAGCRAVLAVPLRAKGEVIGALSIGDKIGRVFSDAEMMLLQTFADQAALALENARLFLDAKRSYEELKRTQDQMIHVEKLRALGEMAGGVAHDFNNLLAAILGRAQYALLTLGDLSEHDLRRSLGVIERAALDGAETVRRLLDFTRGKARQQEWSRVDVSDLLTYVVEASRPRWKDEAEAKGITIQMKCVPGDVPHVAGNPAELREVLLNLVFNAIEAMGQGGTITLRSFMEGGKVSIELRDTGLGMPPEVRHRIFDPFFTTKGPQRSGLGLSVSYGIIRRHDGEIDVESGEGKGTTFTIRLPVRDAPPRQELPVVEAFTSRAYRVLVVDDDESVRDMLKDILGVAGHAVSVAEDGYQALERLHEGRFDFVCTDLGMPGMNGWELVQRIKTGWPGVKIALITGWGVQIEPEEAVANGVDLLISKPFEVREILRALAESGGPVSVRETGAG
jgi:signal transduction histidine kinase/ActR/RegA family two-component response regulator